MSPVELSGVHAVVHVDMTHHQLRVRETTQDTVQRVIPVRDIIIIMRESCVPAVFCHEYTITVTVITFE